MGEVSIGDEKKMRWLSILVAITMGWLLTVAIKLVVIEGRFYREVARGNRMMEMVIPAARGEIIDRKGRVVAKSIYQYFRLEGGNKIYEEAGGYRGNRFEGKDLTYELRRQYSYGLSAGVVTGYVGKVTAEELKKAGCNKSLNNESLVGRGGVEEYFDCSLRGVDGKRLIEVDALGRYVRELGRIEPENGGEIKLSIDAYWQEKIYRLAAGKKVAVVISEPATGRVRVLVSSPTFDPNVFSFEKNDQVIESYLSDDEGLPMLNRAIAAKYHPGSVFKLTVATAGLEDGVIDRQTLFEDTGFIKVGDYIYTNWLWTKRGGTEGMVDIVKAIKRSNDIFFYRLGEKVGAEEMKRWAQKYGLGEKTGIELPGEVAGLIPDEEWKMESKGEKWFLGNTYHMAIGQGEVAVTPIQINQMTNVVANKGVRCAMTLLDNKSNCQDLKISRETIDLITEGMKQACKTGGTAWPLFNFKTLIACKTGTAEVGDGSKDTHAWLTAFAPADNPQISITVMVERGGEGSDVAAPMVGDILKEWFEEPNTVVPRYKDQIKN